MDTSTPHDPHYVVSSIGTGLDATFRCGHGDRAVGLDLIGGSCHPLRHQLPEHIDVIVPRCVAAHMIGTLYAAILHSEGEAAYDAFNNAVLQQAADRYREIISLCNHGSST